MKGINTMKKSLIILTALVASTPSWATKSMKSDQAGKKSKRRKNPLQKFGKIAGEIAGGIAGSVSEGVSASLKDAGTKIAQNTIDGSVSKVNKATETVVTALTPAQQNAQRVAINAQGVAANTQELKEIKKEVEEIRSARKKKKETMAQNQDDALTAAGNMMSGA